MKSLLAAFIACLFSGFSLAQSADLGSPTPIDLDFYTQGTLYPGSINASVPSGLLTMSGAPGNDDVFCSFTAESQGVRVEVVPTDFDAIVEIWEGSSLLQSCNNSAGTGAEVMWCTNLVATNQYVLRVYSIDGIGAGSFDYQIEYLPGLNIRDNYVPTNEAYDIEDEIPGYQVNQYLLREQVTVGFGFPVNITDLIEETEYKFTNATTGEVHYHVIDGSSHVIYLRDVEDNGFICYDETFDIEVQIKLDGNYCGYANSSQIYTEPYPRATMQEVFGGQEYELGSAIQMNRLGPGQSITWYFSSDNGELELDPHQEVNSYSTWCNLNNIECLRYGRIYDVELQASYCGIEGPITDPITIYTVPYPKTKIYDIYCGQTIISNTALNCDIIYKADQYVYQFAPIEAGDPNMIPIGPATLVYTTSVTLGLSGLGLEYDQAYRVGVKSFVQNSDGCDDPQESDYGQFCEIVIQQATETIDNLVDFSDDPGYGYNEVTNTQNSKDDLISQRAEKAFILNLDGENLEGNGLLNVYDMTGKIVLQKKIYDLGSANSLYYDLSNELSQGQYIFNVVAGDKSFSEKVFIQ